MLASPGDESVTANTNFHPASAQSAEVSALARSQVLVKRAACLYRVTLSWAWRGLPRAAQRSCHATPISVSVSPSNPAFFLQLRSTSAACSIVRARRSAQATALRRHVVPRAGLWRRKVL